jgi:outer membrane protein insertion porin family/translocation and assembly module TamA
VDPDEESIIGYHEVGAAIGLDRTFLSRILPTTLSYNWQANIPRSYQSPVGGGQVSVRDLDNVYVSYPELLLALDLRDDPVSPMEGLYARTSVQLANPLLGGTVSDLRVRPELRTFYPLSRKHKVVLATRVKLGFVFPQNYGGTFDKNSDLRQNLYEAPTAPAVINDQQKILFRAFYSGGPNSNRGYGYREVGSQGPIAFLTPNIRSGQGCDHDLDSPSPLPAASKL